MCSPRAVVSPPQALGANARAVDFRQQFFLQRRIVRIGVVLVQGQQQRFLGQLGHPLKVAANADAQHHGRARVRARVAHGLQHHPFHARQAVGRGKHFQLAHVLAAKAFGRHCEFQRVPRHQLHMQDGRGVIPGIHPPQRVAHHGFAQQSFGVALADTLIHRGLEIPGDMHVLPPPGANTTAMPVSWQMGMRSCRAICSLRHRMCRISRAGAKGSCCSAVHRAQRTSSARKQLASTHSVAMASVTWDASKHAI